MKKLHGFFTQKRQESSQLYYIKEQIWLLHFNSLSNEKLDLDDNMTGENNLTYSLTLLIYIQVNEYDYYSDCFSTKVKRPFIVA